MHPTDDTVSPPPNAVAIGIRNKSATGALLSLVENVRLLIDRSPDGYEVIAEVPAEQLVSAIESAILEIVAAAPMVEPRPVAVDSPNPADVARSIEAYLRTRGL